MSTNFIEYIYKIVYTFFVNRVYKIVYTIYNDKKRGDTLGKFNKVPRHFRLDVNLNGFVEAIASKKGITETAVIEMAITNLAIKELTNKEKEEVMVRIFKEAMNLNEEEK